MNGLKNFGAKVYLYILILCLCYLFLDLQNLKRANLKAETLFSLHSNVSMVTKILEASKLDRPKTENAKQFNTIYSEDNRFLQIPCEKSKEVDIEALNSIELKALVKSLIAKNILISNQNHNFLQQIEKLNFLLVGEKQEKEELNAFQTKEIELLQKTCKEMNIKLNDLKETYPIEEKNKTQLKKKTPDNSPDSISSKHEMDDFCQRWFKGEEKFKQNLEIWQFQFKKEEVKNKGKLNRINVEIYNNSSYLLTLQDIRISSSESKNH